MQLQKSINASINASMNDVCVVNNQISSKEVDVLFLSVVSICCFYLFYLSFLSPPSISTLKTACFFTDSTETNPEYVVV